MSTLLVTAPWVVPVGQPPLKLGAVLIEDDRIVEIGHVHDFIRRYPSAEVMHFSHSVICPGLVNAHTHLTLSALHGVVASQPFAQWLPRLVAALKPWEIADHEASGIVGAEECLSCGVTVVGDIAYGAAEVARASAAGLGGVYYWELLGIDAEQVDERLAYLRYPDDAGAYGERVVCGLSPHSPYTAGPSLLRAVHDKAQSLGVPNAIHVAESSAEVDLISHGGGPLADVASRTAHGFTAPGTTTVEYLNDLGVLEGATAVHLCHATQGDIAVLAKQVRGVVSCPRSNRYLHNPAPDVTRFLEAGVTVGVGTDSSASNHDLDLMEEIRAIAAAHPRLEPSRLIEMATLGGARAIGVDDRFGTLSPGMLADLVVFTADVGEDPEGGLIRSAGRQSVRAVMSAGTWRVWDGSLLATDHDAAARAADARARSLAALDRIS